MGTLSEGRHVWRAPLNHRGFDDVLGRLTDGLTGTASISHRILGRILEDLAVAAPAGLLRTDLAQRHSAGSLYKALEALRKEGLVDRTQSAASSKGGRRPEKYLLGSHLWAMFGVHVSVDDGKPSVITAIRCDLDGTLRRVQPRELSQQDEQEELWMRLAREIAELVHQLIDEWKGEDPNRRVLGLGVEVPGHVHGGVVLMADHAGYHAQQEPIALAAEINKHLEQLGTPDVIIVLDNDVNLIALREAYNSQEPLPAHSAVVAVFDQGLGAGLLTGRRRVYRGSGGAAGEPGHLPVFTTPGEPCSPQRLNRSTIISRSHKLRPGFDDPCSCGAEHHADCYVTPDRLLGELGDRPLKDFAKVAALPAYKDGQLTETGRVFWAGGSALGVALVSLMTAVDPGRLVVLLPQALAHRDLLIDGHGTGTVAGLYRQAMEQVVDAHAMSTLAEDARAGKRWLEVRALSADTARGAEKAARNAAVGVLDAFVAHAQERDECKQDTDLVPANDGRDTGESARTRLIRVKKDLEAVVRHHDPELLHEQGAPDDEYDTEVAELLHLIKDGEMAVTAQRVLDVFLAGFPASRLLVDRTKLRRLTRDVAALQTIYTGRRHSALQAVG